MTTGALRKRSASNSIPVPAHDWSLPSGGSCSVNHGASCQWTGEYAREILSRSGEWRDQETYYAPAMWPNCTTQQVDAIPASKWRDVWQCDRADGEWVRPRSI